MYFSPAEMYTYSTFKARCVANGMRVWHDEDGNDGDNVIRRDSRSFAASIGGHDVMSNIKDVLNGDASHDSVHAGWPDVTRAEALADLQNLAVPTGTEIRMCLKYGHDGNTADNSDCSSIRFTISDGYGSFDGSVNDENTQANYNMALCTCVVGVDCPAMVD